MIILHFSILDEILTSIHVEFDYNRYWWVPMFHLTIHDTDKSTTFLWLQKKLIQLNYNHITFRTKWLCSSLHKYIYGKSSKHLTKNIIILQNLIGSTNPSKKLCIVVTIVQIVKVNNEMKYFMYVLTLMSSKITLFWDVTSYRHPHLYRSLEPVTISRKLIFFNL